MKYFSAMFGLMLSLALAGCTSNNLIIVAPNTATAPHPPGSNITEYQFLIAQPCLLTAKELATKTYATAKITGSANAPISERAKTENMSGCASVKFHLAANGTPTDVSLAKESPKDYGFGDQILHAAQASIYEPPSDTHQWYYQTSVVTRLGNSTTVFNGGPDHFAKYAEFFASSH